MSELADTIATFEAHQARLDAHDEKLAAQDAKLADHDKHFARIDQTEKTILNQIDIFRDAITEEFRRLKAGLLNGK